MRYQSENCTVELSVRLLCQLSLRRGDLGDAPMAEYLFDRRDGNEICRQLQDEAGGYYHTDCSFTHTTLHEDITYAVSGSDSSLVRYPDGSAESDLVLCVHSREFYAPPREEYLGQMKCYAYFLASRENLSSIRARLTYYHSEQKKTKYFRYRFSFEELKSFYSELLEKIQWRAEHLILREREELPSAASAPFPYPELREGQEIMIRETYSAIRRGKRLFVEAPTGTGKTVSSLYPAVRALGEGYADKIFYLTAKASTRSEAYRASAKLFEGGARLRTVVITAKEQICACPPVVGISLEGRSRCDSSFCENAIGYYDRVDGALRELLAHGNGYPRSLITQVARRHRVCPYELSLDLSEFSDVIICDYNYAFDPTAYFRRYFSPEAKGGKYVFLIDEAHNLADRARDMYSAVLRRSEFEGVLGSLPEEERELRQTLEAAIMTLRRLKSLCRGNLTKDAEGRDQGFYMSREPLENLNREMEIFRKKCDAWLRKNSNRVSEEIWNLVDRLNSRVREYLAIGDCFDRGFLCYVELFGGDTLIKSYCLDPSPTMNALLNRAHSAILFSATLTPPEYFCDVLGGSKRAVSIALPSPFDPDNLCVAVADYVSTRAEDREKNYARYATVIAATVSAKAGNYIAYFPSYSCLEGALRAFRRKYPKVEVVVQKQGMTIGEREEFLRAFRDDVNHLRVGFCVLGGAFSEGVDLPGSRLIGSIVFGVGLPSLSNERNMIEEYFEQSVGQGYDYAYTYPGMNHVLQAAGRVIRRDEDQGIVVLVDDRYATPKYRALFPAHWKSPQFAGNSQSLAEIARRFWKNKR